jgi:hypothetical protein
MAASCLLRRSLGVGRLWQGSRGETDVVTKSFADRTHAKIQEVEMVQLAASVYNDGCLMVKGVHGKTRPSKKRSKQED